VREYYGSLSYNGNVASTKFCGRKILVLQIGVYISIFTLKWLLLSLFSGPFVFTKRFLTAVETIFWRVSYL
jgi:hypothetical protein